ncbi:MAG: class I SAM-dependent methyltransferase [Terriglobales bacterium]
MRASHKSGDLSIRNAVCDAYSNVANSPDGPHPFPVGRDFAISLGYRPDELRHAPQASVEAFSGVACLPRLLDTTAGGPPARILDLGCGAGLDSFVMAGTFPDADVVGVDFSAAMLARAAASATDDTQPQVSFCQAAAESLPLQSGCFDLALVNGIFNLNPRRSEIFAELARTVRPGGQVLAAEIIRAEGRGPMPATDDNWFA